MSIYAYTPLEYVSNLYINIGSCSINDHVEMFNTLMFMYVDMDGYSKQLKLTERIKNKFRITELKTSMNTHKYNNDPWNEPLIQKSFILNGHKIKNNEPHKIHSCNKTVIEAAYRQVQSKIDYDDEEMKKFEVFAKKEIDLLFANENEKPTKTLYEYLSGLGSKMIRFYEGYQEYQLYQVIKWAMKMHVKTDEKVYINWDKLKEKARNVTAQEDRNKLIMGVVTDYIMKIMDKQEWSGPSKNPGEKCKLFSKFMSDVMYNQTILCADGSAFDSTQHKKLLEIVDNYAFKKVIDNHPELYEIANKKDLEEICYQTTFYVKNKYIKYCIQGTQMTGRMNTCQGNTLRSYLYVKYIIYNMKLSRPWICTDRIRFMVNGDDQIIFLPKNYFDLYCEMARMHVYAEDDIPKKHGLGQIAKIFDRYDSITGAEFLSSILLYDFSTNTFMMVRKLERFLQLTPFTFRNKLRKFKKFKQLNLELNKADALNILSGNLPKIFRKYGETMLKIYLEENDGYTSKKVDDVIKKYNEYYLMKRYYEDTTNYTPIFDEIYEDYLFNQFGITKDDIDEYYGTLDKINSKNYLNNYQINLIDKLYKCDQKTYENNYKEIHKNDIPVQLVLNKGKIDIAEL